MINTKQLPIFLLFIFITITSRAQFTPGNLVVLQAGNGATTPTSTGNQIIFKEYSTSGTATYSMAIPTSSTNALIIRGNATSEGYISRSADANYIVFGGYVQTLPNTTALNSSAPGTISRGVGLIDAAGNYSLVATSSATYAGSDIRGAAATNSANVWATSSSFGANYFGSASSATNVENTKTNLRACHIFNNQLYISSQVTTGTPSVIGVYAVGSGTPNTSAQTVTTVIDAGTGAQPGQFYFNSAGTICYIADARAFSSGGGIQKWVQSSGTWSLAYTLPTGTANIGAFGVVADFSGINPIVYATSTETSANRLVAVLDLGSSSTATTLATASTSNTIFRGLAWSPGSSTCIPVSVTTTSNNAPICSANNLVLNVSAVGSAPINYSWTGTGVFSSTSAANPSITNSASGTYTVFLSNACGSSSAAINVTINPTPTIQVNATSICAGGIATITATGANSYTWNNNSTAPSFTASPITSTNYTINGSSNAGCAANTVTTSITVVSSPSLTVNSPSICIGSSATLTAQGVSTYTWSNISSTNAIVVVNPTVSSSYTVIGNASGCPNTVSVIATVIVNALPSLTLNSVNAMCLSQTSITLSGLPSGGTYSGVGINNAVYSPTTIGTYTVSYTYTNSNGCSNSISKNLQVSNCVSIDEKTKHLSIHCYPNPVKDKLIIEKESTVEFELNIFDVAGRKFTSLVLRENITEIDTKHFPAGLYYIKSNAGNCVFIKE